MRDNITKELADKTSRLSKIIDSQEKDILELKKINTELLQRISKLEGKYENAHQLIYQKIINGMLSGDIRINKEELDTLKKLEKEISDPKDSKETIL